MKHSKSTMFVGAILFGLSMCFTSCEDILGTWDKPTSEPETPSEVPTTTGHALSESVVGEVVGTNGLAYDVAYKDDLPTGVSAAGMVAYKSGSIGLVIALYDIGKVDWSTANGSTSGAAAHTPAVTGQTWRLPSKAEWELMFSANGGNAESYTGLNTAITKAGGTVLQEVGYWTSTEYSTPGGAYLVNLSGGNAGWSSANESYDLRVRACLAF